MVGSTLLPAQIVEALAAGRTILTGNQRAARTLRQHVDLNNRSLNLTHWEPPSILAWDAWTATLWQQLLLGGHTTKLLLNRSQEHSIWRSIIAADPETATLRTADSLAEMAADAFARLCAHRGESRLRTAGVSADTRAFQRWAQAFERRCRTDNYLPQAQLEATLTTAASQLTLASIGYVLLGFDGTTPAQQALIEALRTRSIPIEPLTITIPTSSANLAPAADEPAELQTAANWIRRHLEAHPADHIAIIVPSLGNDRPAIDRVLRQTLAPELEDIGAPQTPSPFEFSLGIPLAQTPIVATALNLLRWTIHALPIDRISQLLLSPYLAASIPETNARAEFDAYELRRVRTLRPELTLEAVLRLTESARRSARLPRLIATLKAMRRSIADEAFALPELRPAAGWADSIRAFLEAAGWSAGTVDSLEFQTRRKWESVLDELATLDFEGVRLTFPDALETLARLADQTLFAPESRNAPVQVLGPLEAAGSTFDAIWFLRASDLAWPVHPGSNPLLAWHLRRELHMPGSSPAEDTVRASQITARLATSAPIVLFSYAQESVAGHQRPSPALASLTLEPLTLTALAPIQASAQLETIDDANSLPPTPDNIIRGGANILKLQAACGFRAFAEQRLWATALDTAEPGMDARERGNTVHIALQHFWREVHDQPSLKELPTDERRAILARAIEAALHKTAQGISDWDAAYLDVQRERLLRLLDPWLLEEMKRQVPFAVKLQETELADVRIGPLRLTLRVDRIDETEFGDVILDYKTGEARSQSWLTDRPDEPQLPLYAVLSAAENLAGVAFAQVRAGEGKSLHGYETQTGILLRPTRPTMPLAAQIDEWRHFLTNLAVDFHEGDIRVRPKNFPTTCEHCRQRILCRLDISLLQAVADDAAEATDTEADNA
ncbi:PD-(D/E)XK nuclease family protein [Granulicella arctica]|uniref:PD-(D/E)XK nuclease family protein n=1 Tax=Granulicella arctica TaxID=940613 RepID=UPI0021E0B8A4|nr:PD-(D/E)XK nuclease family protein [Granulicella arctica]